MERHRAMVIRLCSRMLGERALAEDAYQEAALRCWLNRAIFARLAVSDRGSLAPA